jgi:hypothetical protein
MCAWHLAAPVDLSVRGVGFRDEGLEVRVSLGFRDEDLVKVTQAHHDV